IGGDPTGNILGVDPSLGSLALNAPGATQTQALLPGSPAIDVIPVSGGACTNSAPGTDQRGVARPQGLGCDMGAYEAAAAAPTATPTLVPTATNTATPTAANTPTLTPTSVPTLTPTLVPPPP